MQSTEEKIDKVCDNLRTILKYKNKKYGNSALEPLGIFDKTGNSSICVRLDDKLARIKNSDELRLNDLYDLQGYIALLIIENEFFEIDQLLD